MLKQSQDLLTHLLVGWLVVGVVVIAIQRQCWWEYHYLLLFVPLGLLAAKGIDIGWRSGQFKEQGRSLDWQGKIIILSIILLISLSGIAIVQQGLSLAHYNFALTSSDRLNYQSHIFPDYIEALKETAFLKRPDSKSGDIYVCGQPLYYFLSGRGQAIPLNDWSLEFLLAEQWNELRSQLDTARPAYLVVASWYAKIITQHPVITDFIATHCHQMSQSSAGIWYISNQS